MHENIIGKVKCSLNIAVIRSWHGHINGLIRSSYQAFIPFNIMNNIRAAMFKCLFIKYTKTFNDRFAPLINFLINIEKFSL